MEDIVIRNDATEIHISSTGGTITSAVVDERQILYPWRQVGEKTRGGCHVCAPWFGSSPRGAKKHGYLRDLEAQDVELYFNSAKLVFRHPGNEDYPWSLLYEVGVFAQTDGLKMTLHVKRMGDQEIVPAPVLPAFHPYFGCDNESNVEVLMGIIRHHGFACEARAVPLVSRVVKVTMPGKCIVMELGGAFTVPKSEIVLWTDTPEDYVCVEPVLQDKKSFDTPAGRCLCVGSSLDLSMSLRVL